MNNKKILIVGAGFSGAIIARRLAESGFDITVIDKRNHIAGNAYDYINEHGIRIHKYGPHLFHTSNLKVVEWLSKYTQWLDYKHKVKAMLDDGSLVTLPVNLQTIKKVGRENLLDIFYRPYTKKMWGVEIEQLDPEIINRVPIREDLNEYYFPDDTFQALPVNGYTSLIKSILAHDNIQINLETPFIKGMQDEYFHTFNSMPIDEFFGFNLGRLPYRSIKFHNYNIPTPSIYPVATVNFTHNHKFTRVTEWKKLPGNPENIPWTSLTIEEPCSDLENNFERYYPVKDLLGENNLIYKKYRNMTPENITFIGRCGQYIYINMDQAVSAAISLSEKFIKTCSEISK
jgi:UDP-galactopyranose mutase